MSTTHVWDDRGLQVTDATDRLVVFFAGWPWHGPRGAHRQMAEQLSRYATVLYVEPPRSPLTTLMQRRRSREDVTKTGSRLLGPLLRREHDRLIRTIPWAPPGKERPGIRPVTDIALNGWVDVAKRAIGLPVHCTIAGTLAPVLGRKSGGYDVVYATDDFVAGATLMGVSKARLERQEKRAAQRADLVVACSPVLADRWTARGVNTAMIPNGVDVDLFGRTSAVEPATDVRLTPPIAAVMGRLSGRIDPALLGAVHDQGWSVLLVGSRPGHGADDGLDSLLALPNVQWVGTRPFEDLPAYLAHANVGLVPYRNDAFNRASFPLKTLEYLAAGLPVVATGLPSIQWFGSELIDTAATPADFAAAVARHEESPTPEDVQRRHEFAQAHNWESRGRAFANLIDLPVGPT